MIDHTLRRFSLPFGALAWLASTVALMPRTSCPAHSRRKNFDQGGEGVGYHDNTPGNQGGAPYDADVDIFYSDNFFSHDQIVVKNFESGEWLAYRSTCRSGATTTSK